MTVVSSALIQRVVINATVIQGLLLMEMHVMVSEWRYYFKGSCLNMDRLSLFLWGYF